ncbi:ubiE/COQ5 methyltransferase-like protein [Geothermobacter ehrlichii]|uniref:UbiE/COQ5 methyltransferase-like protein n=1 Tax=Geothermobacter ehrlichii TaxID=213224 RepID=A0A5D3WJ41_9BACT|nr:class I SAM-dependent methyltransferase [Geothermobacter ehrlichii]TYO98228.1 ubiE/COQ5 methyltransferase-like protein [Geothermobacter ehrlichii]
MRKALSREKLQGIYGQIAKRYDFLHAFLTAGTDQKGRRILVENAVRQGDRILDCGSGTGSAGLLAARLAGERGRVTLFDLSAEMLAVAREKAIREGLQDRVTFQTGDMARLPFADDSFDVVLSTYSLCPLDDPEQGALELFRVTRPGGRVAVAHSTEPENRLVRWLAGRIEDIAWRFPRLSMGCRAVSVVSVLERAGGWVVLAKRIGLPLWPFMLFIVEKPASPASSSPGAGCAPSTSSLRFCHQSPPPVLRKQS